MENRNRVYNARLHENFERIHKREDYVTFFFPYMNMDASQNNFIFIPFLFNLFAKKKRGKISKKRGIYKKNICTYIHTYIEEGFFLGRKSQPIAKNIIFL